MGDRLVDSARPAANDQRGWGLRIPVVIAVVALALRLWAPGPMVVTIDEPHWMWRSVMFRQAIIDGNFADASAATDGVGTMPGVTTMWAGAAGLQVATAQGLEGTAFTDRSMLVAKDLVALACSFALWASIVLGALVIGRRAALAMGVLLAAEPWLIGHSHLVHTDAMVTMFGFAGFMAAAAAAAAILEQRTASPAEAPPTSRLRAPVALGGACGGLFALAVLTKLNGLVLLAAALASVTAFGALAAHRDPSSSASAFLRQWAKVCGVAALTFLAVTVTVWPALLVAPTEQMGALGRALSLADQPTPAYFRGRMHSSPPPAFYPIVLALRMSPWLGSAAAAGLATFAWRRVRHRSPLTAGWFVAAASSTATAYAVAIAISTKWYDRYALPLFSFAALVGGVAVATMWAGVDRRQRYSRRTSRIIAVTAAALLVVLAARTAPYGVAYVDPLAGGQQRSVEQIRIGWGEGIEQVDRLVDRDTRGHCEDARVLVSFAYSFAVHCGQIDLNTAKPAEAPDYIVEYVADRQRLGAAGVLGRFRPFATLAGTAKVQGLVYVWLWRVDKSAADAALYAAPRS